MVEYFISEYFITQYAKQKTWKGISCFSERALNKGIYLLTGTPWALHLQLMCGSTRQTGSRSMTRERRKNRLSESRLPSKYRFQPWISRCAIAKMGWWERPCVRARWGGTLECKLISYPQLRYMSTGTTRCTRQLQGRAGTRHLQVNSV